MTNSKLSNMMLRWNAIGKLQSQGYTVKGDPHFYDKVNSMTNAKLHRYTHTDFVNFKKALNQYN